MLFNSLHFLVFFPVVVLFYLIIPRKMRSIWLLAASYYFYMSWNPQYALLMGASTVTTFLTGIMLERSNTDLKKKLCVTVSFVINLSILFFF